MVDLVIAIVSFNTEKLTKDCLDSIFQQKISSSFEVWVVDNASTDGSLKMLESYSKIKLIKSDSNIGFARANNLVLGKAEANYFLLLNSDTLVVTDAIDSLLKTAKEKDYGVCSPKLIYPDKSFQPNGGDLPKIFGLLGWLSGVDDLFRLFKLDIKSFHFSNIRQFGETIGWVAGTAMLIRNDVVQKIGFLDEKLFMYVEDVDFCWRANIAGFRIGWVGGSVIIHFGGGSSKNPRETQWRGEFRGLVYMYNKYYGWLASFLLRLVIVIFGIARLIGFGLLGKWDYVKAYGKVIVSF